MKTRAQIRGDGREEVTATEVVFPSVQEGLRGSAFVEACSAPSRRNGAWEKL